MATNDAAEHTHTCKVLQMATAIHGGTNFENCIRKICSGRGRLAQCFAADVGNFITLFIDSTMHATMFGVELLGNFVLRGVQTYSMLEHTTTDLSYVQKYMECF